MSGAPLPDYWGPGMSYASLIPTKKVRSWGSRQRVRERSRASAWTRSQPQHKTAPVPFLLQARRVEDGVSRRA